MTTATTPTTESAFLVKAGDHWELKEVESGGCRCPHGNRPHPGKTVASGSIKACEAAAKLLGYHIDIIKADPS